jgi:hypothetical protein
MITNDSEDVEIASKSKGVISDETIVSNHPCVEDVAEELKRLKKQAKETSNLDNLDLGDD